MDSSLGEQSLSSIMQKEREFHEAINSRVRVLETSLVQREAELAETKEKLAILQDHFQYNLSLFEKRDAELEELDSAVENLKRSLAERTSEVSDLKASQSAYEAKVREAEQRCARMEEAYQLQLQEVRGQLELHRHQADVALRKREEDHSSAMRANQRRLREKDDALENLRIQLLHGFDDTLRDREREWARREQELNQELETANSNLRAEVAAHRQTQKQLEDSTSALTELQSSLAAFRSDSERRLAQQQSEVDAELAFKDRRITEIQESLQDAQSEAKANAARCDETRQRLRDVMHELEATRVLLKTQTEEERAAVARATESRQELQTYGAELERELRAARDEAADARASLSAASNRLEAMQQELFSRDTDLRIARAEGETLRTALQQANETRSGHEEQLASLTEKLLAATVEVTALSAAKDARIRELEQRAEALAVKARACETALQQAVQTNERLDTVLRETDQRRQLAGQQNAASNLKRPERYSRHQPDPFADDSELEAPVSVPSPRASLLEILDHPPPLTDGGPFTPAHTAPQPQPSALSPSRRAAQAADVHTAYVHALEKVKKLEEKIQQRDRIIGKLKRKLERVSVEQGTLRTLAMELIDTRQDHRGRDRNDSDGAEGRRPTALDADGIAHYKRRCDKLFTWGMSLMRDNDHLRTTLRDATEDIKRLCSERDRLLLINDELQNAWRPVETTEGPSGSMGTSGDGRSTAVMEENIHILAAENAQLRRQIELQREELQRHEGDPGRKVRHRSFAAGPYSGSDGDVEVRRPRTGLVVRGYSVSDPEELAPPHTFRPVAGKATRSPSPPSRGPISEDPAVLRRGGKAVRNYCAS
eukprot:TRINITY_DN5611_c0_g1_i1.p1 TRINITY_DN5611_c0_g1~~TRINITY_DN5611_c0_g1_i1.p1  ORF type:complete len:836 (+),score=156.32 TRINITY_DN5611_c0_g1_i1:56-2563(+)